MNIVIVDNDKALLRSSEILLSAKGHRVIVFDNPLDACSFLEGAGKPDILIIDYLMPEITGEDVLKRVGKCLPRDCSIYLISGHTDLIEPLDIKGLGVNGFLPKPLDIDQLNRMVDK